MTRTMTIAARFTREEYLALPESPPGVRFELLDGELVTMNDPLPVHQKAVVRLLTRLVAWCEAAPGRGQVLLPIDTDIGPDTIFGPDLQWYAGDRDLPSDRERPWPSGDLVVEVASPSTARYDADIKLDRYLGAGAREVWLVRTDPLGATIVRSGDRDRRTVVLAADGSLESSLLPGFALALTALAG
jgi:Uma2 family endonuclease